MKYYLVKETSTATAENPNFAGEVHITYFGKEEEQIKTERRNHAWENVDRTVYMLKDYGYKRICDAKKSYIYKNPENSKFWTSTVEIVEVEG